MSELTPDERSALAHLAVGRTPVGDEEAVLLRLEQGGYVRRVDVGWRLTPTGALAAMSDASG